MKIALSGYYGFDNAGDETLLLAITSSIKAMAQRLISSFLKSCPTTAYMAFCGLS